MRAHDLGGGQEAQSRDLSYRQPYRTSRAGLRSEKRPQSTEEAKIGIRKTEEALSAQ